MRQIVSRIGLIVLVFLGIPDAEAWAPETRVQLLDEAIRLMPASLRLALENNRTALRRGMLTPLAQEDSPEHRPAWTGGTLDAQLLLEIADLSEALNQTGSFAEIAEHFGRVAHFATDAGFPPSMGAGESAKRYSHFTRFCESRRSRFPLVFYGHAERNLQRSDFRAWALGIMDRSRAEDLNLVRAYTAAGDPPNPAAFDDRSIPFAVASLAYSRSFTDIVRVWLTAWEQAGGDMQRTPYRKLDRYK
jgi:hypothetical protein